MKKIIYIGLLFLGLVASSCSKEELVTNPGNLSSAPEWNSNARPENVDLGESDDEPIVRETIVSNGPIINFPPIDGPTGEITDPNNDPDGTKKRF